MKVANGRMTAEATDVTLPNEADVQDMQDAHDAVQSVFDQAMSMGALGSLGAITVRRDKKNGGYYATAPVTHIICGVSKRKG